MHQRITPRSATAHYAIAASVSGGGYTSEASIGRASSVTSPRLRHHHGSGGGHSATFYLLLLVCMIAGLLHVGLTVLTACSSKDLEASSTGSINRDIDDEAGGGGGSGWNSLSAASIAGKGRAWWRTVGRPSGSTLTAKLKTIGGVGVRGSAPKEGEQGEKEEDELEEASADPLTTLLQSDPRYVAALARSLHALMADPTSEQTQPGELANRLAGLLATNIAAVAIAAAGESSSSSSRTEGGGKGDDGHLLSLPAGIETDPALPKYWEQRIQRAQAAERAQLADGVDEEAPITEDAVEDAALSALGVHALYLNDGRIVDGRFSHQTCYLGADESEICVYDGVLCTDGSSPVLVVNEPPPGSLPKEMREREGLPLEGPQFQTAAGSSEPLGIPDPHSDCLDYRHSEASAWRFSSCRYDRSGDRPYLEAQAEGMRLGLVEDWVGMARPQTDYPLDLTNRYFLPINRRDVLVRPLGQGDVWPLEGLGWEGVLKKARLQRPLTGGQAPSHPHAPQLKLAAQGVRSANGRFTVDWLDPEANPHLWLVPGATQMHTNPYFWMSTGVAALYAARRANASLCDAGGDSFACLDPLHPPPPVDAGQLIDSHGRVLRNGAAAAAAAAAGGGAISDIGTGDDGGTRNGRNLGSLDGLGGRRPSPPPPARSWGAHPLDGWVHPPGRGWEYAGQGRSSFRAPALTNNGYGQASKAINTARWVVGPQWGPLPSQDVVSFIGWGGVQAESRKSVGEWYEDTLKLAVQPQAQVYFNDLRSRYNSTHLLCARRGAVTGTKPRIFSSHADAWMFRQYAYTATGLAAKGVLSQAMYPPRKIVVIERKGQHGRGIFNVEDVVAAAHATGLPVEVVPRMDYLTFPQQVELMSGTGILIAPHGAALMNSMFLPAHAVVIELFPPLLRNGVFSRLAATMGLLYYAIHSRTVLPPSLSHIMGPAIMGGPEFARECIETNMSSTDAFLHRWCNQASKTHPIVVPLRVLRRQLTDAVDAIGAYSLLNPEWKKLADEAKLPPPTRLELLVGDPDVELTSSYNASLAQQLDIAAKTTPVPVR